MTYYRILSKIKKRLSIFIIVRVIQYSHHQIKFKQNGWKKFQKLTILDMEEVINFVESIPHLNWLVSMCDSHIVQSFWLSEGKVILENLFCDLSEVHCLINATFFVLTLFSFVAIEFIAH